MSPAGSRGSGSPDRGRSGSGAGGGAGRAGGAGRGGRAGGTGRVGGAGAGGAGRGAGRSGGMPTSGSGRAGSARSGGGAPRSGTPRSGAPRSGAPQGSAGGRGAGRGGGARSAGAGRGSMADRMPWERPAAPKGLDGAQVEGRQAVRELLAANRRRVRTLIMAEGTDDSPILLEIEELAAHHGIPIRRVSKEHLLAQARCESPQGVIAHADPLEEADADDLLDRGPNDPPPFLLALDGLTDPGNLGALLRTADGAGVTGVIVPRYRSVHVTPTVAKSAAGAIEHLPIGVVAGLPAYLLRAKDRGAWVIGLDADSTTTIHDLAHLADQPLIVVVGAEGDGLSRLVRDRCDVIAAIPLRGHLASLNASVAGAVALFEIGRHRPMTTETDAAPPE
jgi:23S rRNA (guanosine2251-2'-O)-methyltransferase